MNAALSGQLVLEEGVDHAVLRSTDSRVSMMCGRVVKGYITLVLTRAGCIFDEKASEVMKSLQIISSRPCWKSRMKIGPEMRLLRSRVLHGFVMSV